MEATVQCRETWSVADKSEFWIQPSDVKNENTDMGHGTDYTTADETQKSLKFFLEGEPDNKLDLRTCVGKIPTPSPTHLDLTQFYADLHKAGGKCVILSVLPHYCEEFRDPVQPVTNPEADVSEDQSEGIEKRTRKQQKSSVCFSAQEHRITDSNTHAVYTTDISAYEVAEVFHDHDYSKKPPTVTEQLEAREMELGVLEENC